MPKNLIRFVLIFLTSVLGYCTTAFALDTPDVIAIRTIDSKGSIYPSSGPLFMITPSITRTLYSELSALPVINIPCQGPDTLLDRYQLQFFQKGKFLKTVTIDGCGRVYIDNEMHNLTSEFSDSMQSMQENGVFTSRSPNSEKITSLKFYFKNYIDNKLSYTQARIVEDKASAVRLYNAIISLPIWPYIPGIMRCPRDDGAALHIEFLQGTTVFQQVDVSLSGCKTISLDGGHATRATSSSFIEAAEQILGIPIVQHN